MAGLDATRRTAARFVKRIRAELGRGLVRTRAIAGYAPSDVHFVVGEPRSGTTWLAEAAADALGVPLVFEPDHPRFDRKRSPNPADGFGPEMITLYQRVLTGRQLPPHSVRQAWRGFSSPRLVLKSVRAVPYLPAIAQHFPEVSKTLIVRHPCAVVESRLRLGIFHPGEIDEIVPPELLDEHPHLVNAVSLSQGAMAAQALRWAVNHWMAAQAVDPSWYTVSYEALLDRDPAALCTVAAAVGCEASSLDPLLARTSSTVWGGATASAVDSWRARLDPADVRLILAVVHAVGIDWYDDDPRPVRRMPGRNVER